MAKLSTQYSVAALFSAIIIASLGTALWQSNNRARMASNRMAIANAEIRQYRQELGYLDVGDPHKIHVVRVPTVGPLRWRWRLHLPESPEYRLHVLTQRIPAVGTSSGASRLFPGGNSVLHAEVVRDHNGKRELRVENVGRGSLSCGLEGDAHRWVDGDASWSSEQAGDDGTQVFQPGQAAVLLRLRVMEEVLDENGEPSREKVPPQGPSDGLMIWISEVENGK